MSKAVPTQEEWLAATATESLNLSEMDLLVKQSLALWDVYEEKKKASSEAFKEAEKLDAKITAALKAAGKTKYHVEGLATVSLNPRPIVRVPSSIESKKQFFKYLRTIGEDVLFSLVTVNSNTLNSWYSHKLEEATSKGILGFSVPGIDDPTTRETLTYRSDRKKNG